MKKLIIIINFLALSIIGQAQACWKIQETETTDFLQGNNTLKKPNIWDWATFTNAPSHTIYYQGNGVISSANIRLPYYFYGSSNSGNNTIQYDDLAANYPQSPERQGIRVEDGWELLKVDFGSVVGNTTIPNNRPFFIIYNKFTGKMKIFILLINQSSGFSLQTNAINIKVKLLDDDKSTMYARDLFAHVDAIVKPVDQFNNLLFFNAPNSFDINETYQWTVAEIQTSYDPCTCTEKNTNKIFKIKIEIQAIATINLQAEIKGILTQKLADNNNKVIQPGAHKLSLKKQIFGAKDAALKSYNEFKNYKTQADKAIDDANPYVKDYLVKKWWNSTYGNSPPIANATKSQKNAAFNSFNSNQANAGAIQGIKSVKKLDQVVGTLKGISTYLPYVGAAYGIFDFFMNLGKSKGDDLIGGGAAPMVYEADLKLTGTLTTVNSVTPISFSLPGSFDKNLNAYQGQNPIYNNVLGVFNILELKNLEERKTKFNSSITNLKDENVPDPFLSQSNGLPTYFKNDYNVNDMNNIGNQLMISNFGFKEPVKYVLNPASGLEIESIDACYVMEYKKKPYYNQLYPQQGTRNLIRGFDIGINDLPNYNSSIAFPFYDKITNTSLTDVERLDELEKVGIYLENITKDYANDDEATLKLRTDYIPFQYLDRLSFNLFGKELPTIYLKLMIRCKVKNSDQITTQIVTYSLSETLENRSSTIIEQKSSIQFEPKSFNTDGTSSFQWNPGEGDTWSPYIVKNAEINDFNFYKIDYAPSSGLAPYFCQSSGSISYGVNLMLNGSWIGITDNPIIVTGDMFIGYGAIIPANKTFKVGGSIFIDGSPSIGNNVSFYAGEKIEINPDAINGISPNVDFQIVKQKGLLYFCDDFSRLIENYHNTDNEITNFCSSTKYRALTQFQKKEIEPNNTSIVSSPSTLVLFVAPNPNNGDFTLKYDLPEESPIQADVLDMNGKVLCKVIDNKTQGAGMYNTNISCANLSQGVYTLRFVTKSQIITKRLMVVNR